MDYKLCDDGKLLFEQYCSLAEQYTLIDPRTAAAWDEWLLHKRGCEKCNGLKGGRNEKSVQTQKN